VKLVFEQTLEYCLVGVNWLRPGLNLKSIVVDLLTGRLSGADQSSLRPSCRIMRSTLDQKITFFHDCEPGWHTIAQIPFVEKSLVLSDLHRCYVATFCTALRRDTGKGVGPRTERLPSHCMVFRHGRGRRHSTEPGRIFMANYV
jgi:hypothetical protein